MGCDLMRPYIIPELTLALYDGKTVKLNKVRIVFDGRVTRVLTSEGVIQEITLHKMGRYLYAYFNNLKFDSIVNATNPEIEPMIR